MERSEDIGVLRYQHKRSRMDGGTVVTWGEGERDEVSDDKSKSACHQLNIIQRRFLMAYDRPSQLKTTTGRPESPRAAANCPRAFLTDPDG